ncbi:hypothetical protein E2C01_047022 [Portunus trituberculatus]|uniref:Uncharacterized protein n=1 Tax=Portunus trituberculatus TaxID=210409 RepID=A0A5B7G6F2_PORTR|nr:hypothetical protein [Portunus trituberculatus]
MNKIILRPGLLPSTGVPTFWKVASGGPQHSLVVIVDTEALELKLTRQFHRSETQEGGQQAGSMKMVQLQGLSYISLRRLVGLGQPPLRTPLLSS